MAIQDDMAKIPALKNVGCALVDLVEALAPGTVWLRKKNRRWVPSPSRNFVTFTVQSAIAQSIAMSLRGHPEEFPDALRSVLPLKAGRGKGAYSDCTVRNPKQLPAAAWYVHVAYSLFQKGGTRVRKRIQVRES